MSGTDNQSNEHVVRKMLATKLPLGLVCMELAAQLTLKHLDLCLVWRRREENQEADELTNQRFGAFETANRLGTDDVPQRFVCMAELEGAMRAWRRELNERRAAKCQRQPVDAAAVLRAA